MSDVTLTGKFPLVFLLNNVRILTSDVILNDFTKTLQRSVKLTIFTVTYSLLIKFQERAQCQGSRVNHFLHAIHARSISLGSEIFYPKLRGLKIFWKSTRVPKFSPDLFSKFLVFISKYTNEVILERQNNRKFKFSPACIKMHENVYIFCTPTIKTVQ